MRAGPLRHRVTLQTLPADQDTDEAGQPVDTWSTFAASVPASIEPLSGHELFTAQQIAPEATTRICVRYLRGVNARMRVLHAATCCGEPDTFYNILFPSDIAMRHRELEMLCASGVIVDG